MFQMTDSLHFCLEMPTHFFLYPIKDPELSQRSLYLTNSCSAYDEYNAFPHSLR